MERGHRHSGLGEEKGAKRPLGDQLAVFQSEEGIVGEVLPELGPLRSSQQTAALHPCAEHNGPPEN